MKSIYNKCKKGILILMMMLCVGLVVQQAAVPVYAYTQEEKEAAKAWLSANGYSPDMGGAMAAYNDYMNGKFGAIPGLPEPNVPQQTTPPADTEEEPTEEPEDKPDKKPEKDTQNDPEDEQQQDPVQNPQTEAPTAPVDEPETETEPEADTEKDTTETTEQAPVDSVELPELVLPSPEQQEFADMVTVFMEGFSESDQEEISKAQLRLEKQKEERAQAEKEAEGVVTKKHNPQSRVIAILCAVLAVAAIGLIVLVAKSKRD